MNYIHIGMLVLIAAIQSTAVAEDSPTAFENCDGCHGPGGVSTDSDVPSIAGQDAAYIAGALRSFQEWGRPCRKSAYRHGDTSRPEITMCAIAAELSDAEVQALSERYAALPFKAVRQDFDAAKAAAGKELYERQCASCHPQGGTASGRGPILAGQWMPYLKVAARQSLAGEHLVPPLMEQALAEFSDADLDALLNYFASVQPSGGD